MIDIKWMVVSLVSVVLAACGGGEGDEACEHGGCTTTALGGATGGTTTVTAVVTISSATSVTASVPVNTARVLTALTGTWSVSGAVVTTLPCITLSDPAGYFTQVRLSAQARNGTFALSPDLPPLPAFPGVIPGVLHGNLTVQAYADANCTMPYTGGSATVPYTITVN